MVVAKGRCNLINIFLVLYLVVQMSHAVRSMEFQSFEMKTEAGSGDGT